MISVFTPVHPKSIRFLGDAAESMLTQRFDDWEWVLLYNGGAERGSFDDPRIRTLRLPERHPAQGSVGALKRYACDASRGEVLVELDADDILTPNALGRLSEVFENDAVEFAYSNCTEFRNDTWSPRVFSGYWGWRSRPFVWKNIAMQQMVAFDPHPNAWRRIEWAPNHVRAWRTGAYERLGGHDPDLKLGDDHDLICRTAIECGFGAMQHIDDCLYLYRLHEENTCYSKDGNRGVQDQVAANYAKYYEPMALRWAADQGLLALDLGGGIDGRKGYVTVDKAGGQIKADLTEPWPLADSSVGVLRASHVLEHLPDPVHAMNEAWRVLAPGGVFFIEVPSTDGRGAFMDPTHRSFWNENSFFYYTRGTQARYIPEFKGAFQASRVETMYPGPWWRENRIPVVRADLICLKDGYKRAPGEVLIECGDRR